MNLSMPPELGSLLAISPSSQATQMHPTKMKMTTSGAPRRKDNDEWQCQRERGARADIGQGLKEHFSQAHAPGRQRALLVGLHLLRECARLMLPSVSYWSSEWCRGRPAGQCR